MLQARRLVRKARAADAFSGEGAFLFGGRWNPEGWRVVYLSATRSLAALEVLVHQPERIPKMEFVFFEVRFPQEFVISIKASSLLANWKKFPPQKSTVEIGETWLREGQSPVLEVPSILIPQESNFLINPDHPLSADIEVEEVEDFSFDPRFLAQVAAGIGSP